MQIARFKGAILTGSDSDLTEILVIWALRFRVPSDLRSATRFGASAMSCETYDHIVQFSGTRNWYGSSWGLAIPLQQKMQVD